MKGRQPRFNAANQSGMGGAGGGGRWTGRAPGVGREGATWRGGCLEVVWRLQAAGPMDHLPPAWGHSLWDLRFMHPVCPGAKKGASRHTIFVAHGCTRVPPRIYKTVQLSIPGVETGSRCREKHEEEKKPPQKVQHFIQTASNGALGRRKQHLFSERVT